MWFQIGSSKMLAALGCSFSCAGDQLKQKRTDTMMEISVRSRITLPGPEKPKVKKAKKGVKRTKTGAARKGVKKPVAGLSSAVKRTLLSQRRAVKSAAVTAHPKIRKEAIVKKPDDGDQNEFKMGTPTPRRNDTVEVAEAPVEAEPMPPPTSRRSQRKSLKEPLAESQLSPKPRPLGTIKTIQTVCCPKCSYTFSFQQCGELVPVPPRTPRNWPSYPDMMPRYASPYPPYPFAPMAPSAYPYGMGPPLQNYSQAYDPYPTPITTPKGYASIPPMSDSENPLVTPIPRETMRQLATSESSHQNRLSDQATQEQSQVM